MSNRRTFLSTLSSLAVTPALAASQPATPQAAADPKQPQLDIFEAAFKGDLPRATELAKLNPAIAKLRSLDGRTPLHFAAAGGHAEMIFFLTQQGADLSAGPESPLIAAVDYPDHAAAMAMSTALLMNASDPRATRVSDGKTALAIARARGYNDVAELIAHRTDEVYFGKRYAFDAEGRPYQRENIDGLPQDFINEFARLSHFDVERVKHLLKLAPSLVHGRATWDESGIEAASHMGLVPLARHLADHGAAVSTCTATLLGLRDRVTALVKSDAACVRERGAHDLPLMAYTAYGDERHEIADVLLTAGADLRARAFGMTILHLAATKGYVQLAELLVSRGADVNATAKVRGEEATPLAVAVRAKQDRMADFLKSRGGKA
jgi:ankyrin repeat protein